jgi:NAD-dependent dihydropyrimidine dehydrogenase PreA subunit
MRRIFMKTRYLKNVVTLQFDGSKCTNCGKCIEVCPQDVFEKKDGIVKVRDRDLCMECGACAINCPFSAIRVRAGVGCAAGVIAGKLTGSDTACCG